MSPEPLRIEGTLRSWDDDRGFGFLESPNVADTFSHISAFAGRPHQGERFTFVIGFGSDGRTQAEQVRAVRATSLRPPRQEPPSARPGRISVAALYAPLALGGLLTVLILVWDLSSLVVGYYAVVSLVTFVGYALDKAAAGAGRRREPEATLLGLGLIGGWPGAILAQQLLRHKTVKADFQRLFWASVIGNVLVLVALAALLHYGLPA